MSQVGKVIGLLNEFLKELLSESDMMSPKIAPYLLLQGYFNGSSHTAFTKSILIAPAYIWKISQILYVQSLILYKSCS